MKTNTYKLLLCGILLIAACKKDSRVTSNISAATVNDRMIVTAIDSNYLPLTVLTIAGMNNRPGHTDGIGKQAQFNGLRGIDMMADGSIYVSDFYNDKIRKITPPNTVSTINIPPNNEGFFLDQPVAVRVAKDGTINIIAINTTDIRYKIWIVKPNGDVITPSAHARNYNYYDLAKDPYSDDYWFCGTKTDWQNVDGGHQGVLEKLQMQDTDTIGTNTHYLKKELLAEDDRSNPSITSMFYGYNGVKYLVVKYKHIYKLTPSGQFTLLFPNITFNSISCIIATKDSRTFYIVDNGAIKSYFNGKLQYLVGRHEPFDGGDGVGTSADAAVYKIALSKDENTIYFTDFAHNTLRKVLLK